MISLRKKSSLLFLFFLFASACSAQYRFREIRCKKDKDLIFPVFISENKIVTKKINDYLQMEFFETTTSKTPESKLFDEDRFISDDTVSQTGYTSISYRVELNTPKILSVIFEVEAMGAYPTYYKEYFGFNSKSGEPLTAKELFTEEGLTEIKKILIEERGKRIKERISEIKADDEKLFIEDSAFIIENFTKCNVEPDEENIFINKEGITFYKGDCFPHAWMPYNADLDIVISNKEIEKYLSDLGKRILFTK